MDDTRLVTQSNQVTEAQYKMPFNELVIFKLVVSSIHKKDKDFQEYYFEKTDLCKLLNIKEDGGYSQLRATTKRMMKYVIEIPDKKGGLAQYNLFSKVYYAPQRGQISFQFHADLKPHFLELKGLFTQYYFQYIPKLKTAYNGRLYELSIMIIGRHEGTKYYDIEDLQKKLKLPSSYIKRPSNLVTIVLKPGVEAISEETDITLSYNLIRKGRGGKIVGIEFNAERKATSEEEKLEAGDVDSIHNQINKTGIEDVTKITVTGWLNKYTPSQIQQAICVAEESKNKGKVIKGGFITKALQGGWVSKAEVDKQEQQKARNKVNEEIEREKAKTYANELLSLYSDETTKIVKKWHSELPRDEQEAIETQFKSQRTLLKNKAGTDSGFYKAHLKQLYKQQYPLESFNAWFEKYARVQKIELTKPLLMALVEMEK